MKKISKVEADIQTLLKKPQGEKEKRPAYLKRLVEDISELSQEDWDALPAPAQEWQVAGQKALNDDKPVPDFDDAVEANETKEDGKAAASSSNKKEDETVSTKKNSKKAAVKPAAKGEKKPAVKKEASGKGGRGVKGDGYKGHRVGSNKETVHKVFDEKGAEAAVKKAVALGIKEGSAKSWISSWGGGKAKKAK